MFSCTPPAPIPAESADRFAAIDTAVEAAVARGDVPGALVIVGHGDDVVYRKAFGQRVLGPKPQPLAADHVFDLASLTKPITAMAVMKLVEQGGVDLDAPAARYLPEFAPHGKDAVTVRQLLLHRSGLIADNAMTDYALGPARAWQRICQLELRHAPGERFVYSDVGYIVLGRLVEMVSGQSLEAFVRTEIFEPLGMTSTAFRPPAEWRDRTVPTTVTGRVHDPRAWALGGVAGHAGVFSTADDLAKFCRAVLRTHAGRAMSRVYYFDDGARTLGFDADTAYSSARGERFGRGTTFGHTGFTGTMFWLDPVHDVYVIVLASRLQMTGGGATKQLRSEVATAAAEALLGPTRPAVLTGIDVLVRDGFSALAGRRVGLITNHTGVDSEGRRTIDLLHGAANVELVALFSPEHGIAGKFDEKVGHGRDETTGLPVWSLYGETRRPTEKMLAGLDTLVFEIQDVGTRFYTYIATMKHAMEAAAEHKLRFVVLDRPNPIAALGADGPIADGAHLSFVACAPIPVTHGLTVGELARHFNRSIGADLHIVEMENWRRSTWWDETHLRWVSPSPNMRRPIAAVLYPAIGLLEFTNISVGRGTDQPFEWLGAPWIDGVQFAAALNEAGLPGLRFHPLTLTPDASKHAGERCGGVAVELTDRSKLEPTRTALTIAATLRRLYGDTYEIDPLLKLLADERSFESLKRGEDPAKIAKQWRTEMSQFDPVRIYPE